MIEITKLKNSEFELIKHIQLDKEQVKFACTAEAFLRDESETLHLHVIKLNGDVVGFFKLDLDYSASYDFCPDRTIGLRSFVLDKNQQGKGIGKQSVKALFPYLKSYYGQFDSIYLTVNCKNKGAKVCYQKSGFNTSKDKYLGGAAGPQYIMYATIF